MYKDFKKSESLDTGFVGGSGIIWMFSGIVLGLLFGMGMYYFSNDRPRISVVDSLQKKIENAQAANKTSNNQLAKQESQNSTRLKQETDIAPKKELREHKFSYYAVLPNLDVPVSSAKPIDTTKNSSNDADNEIQNTVAIDSVTQELEISEPITATNIGDYLLQVASFKKESMADKTRGRLSTKGIDAYVQKKMVNGRYWYRVVAGPVDQIHVDNWKQTAEQLGHRPLVISVR
jgi:cell division protein FtsN